MSNEISVTRKNCQMSLKVAQKLFHYILAPIQKLHKNVGDLGILVVAKGFKKLPKAQKIAQAGHIESNPE